MIGSGSGVGFTEIAIGRNLPGGFDGPKTALTPAAKMCRRRPFRIVLDKREGGETSIIVRSKHISFLVLIPQNAS
jgi:hypothetical protein